MSESLSPEEVADDIIFNSSGGEEGRLKIISAIRSAVEEKESEIRNLLAKGCIVCASGNGLPNIKISFKDLGDAQRLHKFLVELKVVSEASQ